MDNVVENKNVYKAGFVGLIGQPNAGKSSLMNVLVQEKVSIVTAKPQTTRRRMMGIVNNSKGQIIFVDAPGILRAKEGLNGFLALEAQDVMQQSDLIMVVLAVDAKDKEDAEQVIKMVEESGKKWFAVITKVDLVQFVHRRQLLKDMCALHKNCLTVIEYSNQWSANELKDVRAQIEQLAIQYLPESPKPLYDVDLFTPHTMKELVTEIVREQCFEVLHHEIPYQIAVRMQKYDESNPKLPKIYAEILVGKESQKPILIGKKASVIKEIGTRARMSLEKMLGTKVFLSLEVSVRDNWYENKNLMKELGYVIERK